MNKDSAPGSNPRRILTPNEAVLETNLNQIGRILDSVSIDTENLLKETMGPLTEPMKRTLDRILANVNNAKTIKEGK